MRHQGSPERSFIFKKKEKAVADILPCRSVGQHRLNAGCLSLAARAAAVTESRAVPLFLEHRDLPYWPA